MSSTIKASYTLHPPNGTQSVSRPSTNTHTVDVPSGQDFVEYYRNLHKAVTDIRTTLGRELTVWRDAVGKLENSKEVESVKKKSSDDEDSEDADLEGEGE